MMERVRKIDVNSLSEQELKNIEDTLSKKIIEISEKAAAEANKYLNIYGFKAIMAIQFKPLESESLELDKDDN
jgi:hypothetical protein